MMNENAPVAAVATDPRNDGQRIRVSALIDGELDGTSIEATIDALLDDDELARFWADAHRAGDWMRSDEVVGVGDDDRFMARLAARLAEEPSIVAPRPAAAEPDRGSVSSRFWTRAGLPGVAVAAALVVVAWVAAPFGRDGDGRKVAAESAPTLAVVTAAPAVTGVAAPVEWRAIDAEPLNPYLEAHRDVTPFAYRGAAVRAVGFTTTSTPSDASTVAR
jgi:sigma-E factor negative regulatory protein RseA